ncbi:AAA family ATPase [Paenibacillus sp. FSL R10-2199]|uniref:AAA family ATPase n=1 Tax=Paenibacillus sp. FSL R10-2199 TaxID=2975348 RepID=UPI0030F7D808
MIQISLIGPSGVGKTTVSKLLAKYFNIEYVSLDSLRALQYGPQLDEAGINRYSEEGNLYIVQNVLQVHQNEDCILDFGSQNCAYKEEKHFNEFHELVQQIPNVVLLLPSADFTEGDLILRNVNARSRLLNEDMVRFYSDEHRVIFESNPLVAEYTVHTIGLSPDEITDRIVSIVK